MSEKKDLDWRSIGFEVAAIVFAVLLALWLEGWRNDVELADRAATHLDRIRAEVQQNRESLVNAIAEHEAYMTGLGEALETGDLDIQKVGPFLQIEGGATSDAAWRSAQLSQSIAAMMPLETLNRLSALYETQGYYTDYLNYFFQDYVNLITEIEAGDEAPKYVQKFRRHLSVTNSLAEQLLNRYDTFLGNGEGE
ncbi:MAG: hypothetical protein JJ850_00195 [Kordiimonadaceae bacterium]|nr:hypothetical protein [Kordiimonadaceae bacterium]MBO6567782.1 hypothetical protein [Kordiimonadaceae bacterium]MBO6963003.1 hypothetical protein [Kordiimonadaceae bacterium]